MPRHADPQLEQRILSAAERLWRKDGERTLTMRAVARSAGTTTPTVYERFRNRDEILRALILRSQARLYREIEPSRSLAELWARMLAYCCEFPHEYELLSSDLIAKLEHPRPNLEFALARAAEWFGGRPNDHYPLILALWSLLQGTIALLKTLPHKQHGATLSSATTAARVLIRNRVAFTRAKVRESLRETPIRRRRRPQR